LRSPPSHQFFSDGEKTLSDVNTISKTGLLFVLPYRSPIPTEIGQ
jgi:hypothetical protein